MYERINLKVQSHRLYEEGFSFHFCSISDLSTLIYRWVSSELRSERYYGALTLIGLVLRRCLGQSNYVAHSLSYYAENLHVLLFMQKHFWVSLCDLESRFGSMQSSLQAVNEMIHCGSSTGLTVNLFTNRLFNAGWCEAAYRVFEKSLVHSSNKEGTYVYYIYLKKVISRTRQVTIHRTRDIFERVLSTIDPRDKHVIYNLLIDVEERYGTVDELNSVLFRATRNVDVHRRLHFFKRLIDYTWRFYGAIKLREIYDSVLQCSDIDWFELHDWQTLCLGYAAFEISMGEYGRARAIYVFTSRFAVNHSDASLTEWKRFETRYGDEASYLRVLDIISLLN